METLMTMRKLLIAVAMLLTTIVNGASGDQVVTLSLEEKRALIESLATDWRSLRIGFTSLGGAAHVEQDSYESILRLPKRIQTPSDTTDRSPQNISPQYEERAGDFRRIMTADVEFKADLSSQRTWCRWNLDRPEVWVDAKSGEEVLVDTVSSMTDIVTEKDFFHYQSKATAASVGDALPNILRKMDMQAQRDVIGGARGIVFRNEPTSAKAHSERSHAFNPFEYLNVGGSHVDVFLTNRLTTIGTPNEVSVTRSLQDGAMTTRSGFRASIAAEPSLIVETTWIPNSFTKKPTHLLRDVVYKTVDAGSEFIERRYTWEWEPGQLVKGIAVPKMYRCDVFSSSNFDRLDFRRVVIFTSWRVNDAFADTDFTIAALGVKVGDLVHDKVSDKVTYVGRDAVAIPLKDTKDNMRSHLDGSGLLYFFVVATACSCIGYLLSRRSRAGSDRRLP